MPRTAEFSIVALVREQIDALDGFIAEVEPGVRDQRHVDDLDERLGGIVTRLGTARTLGRYRVAGAA